MQNSKSLRIIAAAVLLAVLLGGSFYIGYESGMRKPKNIVVQGVANIDGNKNVDFGTFWQAWQLIDEMYLRNGEVDDTKRVQGAIRGLVSALGDPYTQYFAPKEGEKFQEDIQGQFGGVGIELGRKKDRLVVVAPLKNTPADLAGVQAGDMILAINSTSTDGLNVDEAVVFIRGKVGTVVELTMFREGWDRPKPIKLTRAVIEVPTLEYSLKKDGVGYIQLSSFNTNASRLFYDATRDLLRQGAKGIVLDLRNNPGGYLEVAVDLAGWFLPKDSVVVSEATRDGVGKQFRSEGTGPLGQLPTVVLINKGSASASEILAGALRDVLKTPLVGETSFGKGTVQQLETLRDGSSIKVTTAHWVLPSGGILDHGGLKPDVEVLIPEEMANSTSTKDIQLDKAIEVLKSRMK